MHTSVHAETEKKNHKQTDLYAMSMLTVHFEMRKKTRMEFPSIQQLHTGNK